MKTKIIKFIGVMWIPFWIFFFMATNASDFPPFMSWLAPDIFWAGSFIGIAIITWKLLDIKFY
jgi:hypothetical protein